MKIFNQNQSARIQKSVFDLSHERKLSCRMGELVPILVQEVVPGDKFHIDTQSMIRLAPMVAPMMHRVNVYCHYFYVPNRILWDNWEAFITNNSELSAPMTHIGDVAVGSLGDHLGLPVGEWPENTALVSKLPSMAYFQIYNDYYRDENLQHKEDITQTHGRDLLRRCWQKDYFTSALPWAQKGAKVTMDVSFEYKAHTEVVAGTQIDSGAISTQPNSPDQTRGYMYDAEGNLLKVDNLESASVEVEELRRATRLQRWLERNARSGNRYVETLLAHFGIKSSDARLQRAEYLGGGKSPVVISEVLNMTGTEEAPQGQMAGHGISVGRSNKVSKFIEEHGYIIGIMSVMPETTYQQGIPKHFSRVSSLDYYWPEFAQLGEQEVKNQELYLTSNAGDNQATFGYQSRYAEYKYNQSTVHGEFRTTLDFWHMGRKFSNLPALNGYFVKCDPTERVFAVEGQEQLYVQLYHKITAVRPMPFFNDPKL